MVARFRFAHVWSLPAPPPEVYARLADVDGYARWWPQVRSVARVDADSGDLLIRSVLPVALRLRLTRRVEDPVARVLEVAIEGDLRGWSRWVVTAGPEDSAGRATSRACFAQEVVVARPVLAALAPYFRPLLVANHAAMMHAGEQGLRAELR